MTSINITLLSYTNCFCLHLSALALISKSLPSATLCYCVYTIHYTPHYTMGTNCNENDSQIKIIIGKLINKAEPSLRPVISSFDHLKSRTVVSQRLNQFSVTLLESCAQFLDFPVADKEGYKIFTKASLVSRIYLGFMALLPAKCGECGDGYVIEHEPETPPLFTCFRCFKGSHSCDRNKELHQTLSVLNIPTGFVWLCDKCHASVDPIEPRKQRSRHQSASTTSGELNPDEQSIDSSHGSSFVPPDTGVLSSTQNCVNAPPTSLASSSGNQPRNCKKFLSWNCPHGLTGNKIINGNSCPFKHPRICKQFRSTGFTGCSKGSSCRFYHPEICKVALESGSCLKRDCRKFHPRSIKRKGTNEERGNNVPRNSEQQPPEQRNESNSKDFLELRDLVTSVVAKLEALEKKVDVPPPVPSLQPGVAPMLYPATHVPHMMNLGLPRVPHQQLPHHYFY